MLEILTGKALPQPQKSPPIRVSTTVYNRYFTKNQPAEEIQSIVEKALAQYFNGNETVAKEGEVS